MCCQICCGRIIACSQCDVLNAFARIVTLTLVTYDQGQHSDMKRQSAAMLYIRWIGFNRFNRMPLSTLDANAIYLLKYPFVCLIQKRNAVDDKRTANRFVASSIKLSVDLRKMLFSVKR